MKTKAIAIIGTILVSWSILIMIVVCIAVISHDNTKFADNPTCVVINKNTQLVPHIINKNIMLIRKNDIECIGVNTGDTLKITVEYDTYSNIEIGDTINTINLK